MVLPKIDPVIFYIYEPWNIALRWYALMYLVGILLAMYLGYKRADKPNSGWTREQVYDFLFYCFLALVVGGRIGYVIFYQPDLLLNDFWQAFNPLNGGMSFHGGFLGVVVACYFYGRAQHKNIFEIGDFCAPLAPLGLFAGRIGNFINGELWGRPVDNTDFWLAMQFPTDPSGLLRHPSQLYQAFTEGLLLFIILWWFTSKPRPQKAASGLFLLGYGTFRFFVEYFREPDAHLGLYWDLFSKGQLLCMPMIIVGAFFIYWAYQKPVFTEDKKLSKKG